MQQHALQPLRRIDSVLRSIAECIGDPMEAEAAEFHAATQCVAASSPDKNLFLKLQED
jgi:hypothetical protein